MPTDLYINGFGFLSRNINSVNLQEYFHMAKVTDEITRLNIYSLSHVSHVMLMDF